MAPRKNVANYQNTVSIALKIENRSPEVRESESKSGSRINNQWFTYLPALLFT